MKQIILSAILLTGFTANIANAQQIRIATEVGYSFSAFTSNDKNYTYTKAVAGYHIGFSALLPLAKQFYFGPGISYNSNNSTVVSEADKLNGSLSQLRLNYINVPLNFYYYFPIAYGSFVVNAGPFIGFGINGKQEKWKRNIAISDEVLAVEKQNIHWGKSGNASNGINGGFNLGLAYEHPAGVYFKAQYYNNQTPVSVNEFKNIKQQSVVLSLGYAYKFKNKVAPKPAP